MVMTGSLPPPSLASTTAQHSRALQICHLFTEAVQSGCGTVLFSFVIYISLLMELTTLVQFFLTMQVAGDWDPIKSSRWGFLLGSVRNDFQSLKTESSALCLLLHHRYCHHHWPVFISKTELLASLSDSTLLSTRASPFQ